MIPNISQSAFITVLILSDLVSALLAQFYSQKARNLIGCISIFHHALKHQVLKQVLLKQALGTKCQVLKHP